MIEFNRYELEKLLMLLGQKILAIVPARGGSKGVSLKNLQEIHGIPLVGWAGKFVSKLSELDRSIVSTDHEKIAIAAEEYGLAAPFRRSKDLSGDFIGDIEVLEDGLIQMEKIDGCRYDVVLMLQPTSPLRKIDDVRAILNMLITKKLDSVWSISATDIKYHPLKQLTFSKGNLNFFDNKGGNIIARQQLNQIYHRNGIAYALSRECLLNQKALLGKNSSAYIIEDSSISIDTLQDINKVSKLLKLDSY